MSYHSESSMGVRPYLGGLEPGVVASNFPTGEIEGMSEAASIASALKLSGFEPDQSTTNTYEVIWEGDAARDCINATRKAADTTRLAIDGLLAAGETRRERIHRLARDPIGAYWQFRLFKGLRAQLELDVRELRQLTADIAQANDRSVQHHRLRGSIKRDDD